MVFLCLGLSVFSTIEDHEYEDLAETSLFYLEVLVVVWFGIEFIVRLWSSGCRSRYQGWIGRLRFMKSPFCIIGNIIEFFYTYYFHISHSLQTCIDGKKINWPNG